MTGHGPGSQECRELFARLSEYLDGELDPAACGDLERHLGDCTPCQKFLESLRRTVVLVSRIPGEPLPDSVRRALHDALRSLRQARER